MACLPRGPLVAALALLLVAALPVHVEAATTTPTSPGPDPGTPHYTRSEALAVLAEAKSQFRRQAPGQAARSLAGHSPDTDITLTLRDLSRARTALSGAALRQADNLLARPTNGSSGDAVKYGSRRPFRTWCPAGSPVCLHWVTRGANRVSPRDTDHDRIPNYVERVNTTMRRVWNFETRRLGYRKPLSDRATAGRKRGNPNGRFDVYLAELGNVGLYGYCAPEGSARVHRLPGYCVLDNDYARSQYGSRNILNPLRVTAAHEFFHAIQFAYDVDEDLWFMEGTATWVEDEVFPTINDNRQYLAYSPIRYPRWSADYTSGLHRYGSWILFRFAAEYLRNRAIVRLMWEAADSARGRAYSLQAIRSVVAARTSWPLFMAQFARWNTLTAGTLPGAEPLPHAGPAPQQGAERGCTDHRTGPGHAPAPGQLGDARDPQRRPAVLPAADGGGERAGHQLGFVRPGRDAPARWSRQRDAGRPRRSPATAPRWSASTPGGSPRSRWCSPTRAPP